jgi:eukaryotic-like serine/threonine-protein kinase
MVGRTASHYQVVEKLGSGGMGVVYRATDCRLGRSVALKFLPDEFGRDSRALDRLRHEAKAASSLNHPNIRTIYDIDEVELPEAGHVVPFIVMELLEGQTLDHHMGPLRADTRAWLALAIQIADALGAAHAKGIVHRDVKPENIFVTTDGTAKVLDFGLAAISQSVLDPGAASTRFTQPGATLGTPAYMSPEQIRGETVRPPSDVYSLGVVLYEMATGRPPFCGSTIGVLFDNILNRTPPLPSQANPSIDPEVEAVVLRALEKVPERRYPSASDLAAELRGIRLRIDTGQLPADVRRSGARSGQVPVSAGSRRWLLPAVGALAVAVGAGGAAWPYLAGSATRFQPCIEIGGVRATDQAGGPDAKLLEFSIRRGLSQFADPPVCDAAALADAPGRRRQEPAMVADVTLGRVQGSRVRLDVDLNNRGKKEQHPGLWSGFDRMAATTGIDRVVALILARFDAANPSAVAARPPMRSMATLLSAKSDAVAAYWEGSKALDRLDMGVAGRAFESALEMDADFALAAVKMSQVWMFKNQWGAAQRMLESARRRDPALTQSDRYWVAALQARASADPFEERSNFQLLIDLEPRCRECAFELGESYFHTAEVEEAIKQYLQVIALDPRFGRAYNHLGYCYAWKGDHALALDTLKKYFDLDKSSNAYDSLGDAAMMRGDYAAAVEAKQKALSMDPQLYYAVRSLAYIDLFQGRYRKAASDLDRALSNIVDADEQSRIVASIAFIRYRQGKVGEAVAGCERGLALKKQVLTESPVEELLWIRGLAELRRGRIAAARSSLAKLEQALRAGASPVTANNFKPVFKHWLHLRAACAAAEHETDQAMEALESLAAIQTRLGYWGTPYDAAFFLGEIARLAESLGRTVEAERWLREALAYNSHMGPARLQLAALLARGRKTSEAREELGRFMDEWRDADPDSPEFASAAALTRALGAR